MLGIGTLLVLLLVALLVTRVATVALRSTGLSDEVAHFQARSAFSGVGFTTLESEDIVSHPARRQIVTTLMLLSSAGVVTTLGSLVLGFAGTSGYRQPAIRLGALVLGLLALWALASNEWFDNTLSRLITPVLSRYTTLDVRDYVRLLHIHEDYAVAEMTIDPNDWLAGRRVEELRLTREGVVVLGVHVAAGNYLGAPSLSTRLEAGDTVLLYGVTSTLDELQARRAGPTGDAAHERSAAAYEERATAERRSIPGDDRLGTRQLEPGGSP